ncbi:uncharacterized protein MYCFIDRAFT_79971 [Pseudocercospora fijiensis CIRAD86]|uniref:Uncharacterized protein n=1 Tax=Pseudocercospora fijiensis (strain CIRAD86) TaxID=383855 RepID=N1QBM8_PSEFD|nr:uncharacterized protein MYCFIDRAFT_79971 [Pseudocercospora fijiensis CIRAD86]EME88617.1 hypothetical protein MYCFIDRAFT_79971 [Pseudocercospora fijiensis CIRAD86]
MAGIDVGGCMSAITSAFQGGADLVQSLQERKQQKRKRKESDMEQVYAEKMLHRALVDAAEKTQTECVERRHRHGRAFVQGDSLATAELKDVMIGLQMEVIQPLQLSRASENAVLDTGPLHEAVITYKATVIRSLVHLCYRISVSSARQTQYSSNDFVSPVTSPGLPQRMSLNFGALSLQELPPPRHPDRASYHRPSTSIASTVASDVRGSSSAKTSPETTLSSESDTNADRGTSSGSTCDGSLSAPEVYETEEDMFRANSAPEVVTKEYESMLSQQALRSAALRGPPMKTPKNAHPAYQNHYMEAPITIFEEPDYPWSPLTRPAKHNNYHNFCKGAWLVRQKLEEGLSITMLPNTKGTTTPYWKCKHCAFRSKAPSTNSTTLPDSIYFDARGIRYRWVFLAKSHSFAQTPAEDSHDLYSYCCIFCAAQGTQTTIYKNLKALLEHVVSRHKTYMLTPEVKEKTRCVVGGAPGKDVVWDVNLPETQGRSLKGSVGKFVISAVTGLG